MFDWIPFVVSAVVLIWALASFRQAATGGQQAGLHELLLPGESTTPAGGRGGRVAAVVLALVVLVVALALFAYAIWGAS
jgi:hypothetical protein